jgi:hypothetical protein
MLFLCLLACPSLAQESGQQPAPRPNRGTLDQPMTDDDARDRLTREMAKKAAKERAAALKNDTDKLLKLSVELKQYVDKAEEIEKLARSVKDKMKGPN